MARKRREPSPQPPPPPQEESSEESGSEEEEEEEPHLPVSRMPPQAAANAAAAAAAAAAADDDDEGDSDSDTDAQAFQLRQVHRSPTKPPHSAHPQSESDADDDEDGESSESEPEDPEPVAQKKTAAAVKSKVEQARKRPASDPAPAGKAKKSKAGAEKATVVSEASSPSKAKKGKAGPEKPAPEATPAGKAKKGKADPEKAAPEATPSVKGKKAGTKSEKLAAHDPSPADSKSDKPARPRVWAKGDEMKILEALAEHVKSNGVLPKNDVLIGTVCERLERKNCSYMEIYEKVRRLKERYVKAVTTGIVPSKEDELQMYNISEAIWGEKVNGAVATSMSQKDGAATKSKKGHTSKGKMDGNSVGGAPKEAATTTAHQNGDSQKGSKKGQAITEKTVRDVKGRLSKEATTTATLSKSKKHENHNEELDKHAKDGTLEEADTTGTQNDTYLAKSKREKTDKGKMNRDTDNSMPKEATTRNQNGGTQIKSKEVESHDEEIESDANVQGMHRGFEKLQELYSNLALYVEEIEAHHPCGETLKRSFEFIGDEKAKYLESKIKRYRVEELKVENRRADIQKEVLNVLLGLTA